VSISIFFNSSSSLPLSWLLQWLLALSTLHCHSTTLQLIISMLLQLSTKLSFQNQLPTQNTNSTMELKIHILEMLNHNMNIVMEMSLRDNTHSSNQTVQSELLTTPLMIIMDVSDMIDISHSDFNSKIIQLFILINSQRSRPQNCPSCSPCSNRSQSYCCSSSIHPCLSLLPSLSDAILSVEENTSRPLHKEANKIKPHENQY
jgi:hypothetical protein